MIQSQENGKVYLRSIAHAHTPSNARQYQFLIHNGEIKYGGLMGHQTDAQPQTGKLVDMNDDWVVLKTARTTFFLCAKSLMATVPDIGDTITITPYSRKKFNGERLDAPEKSAIKEGFQSLVYKIGEDNSYLPIDKKLIKCPELRELINQVEIMRTPDGQRTIAQMLIDNGANESVAFNDPSPSKIISSPPSLTFNVDNDKIIGDLMGELTISYDRGMDLYDVKLTNAQSEGPIEVESVDFSSLAQVVHDMVDDGNWKIATVEMIKPAPKKRLSP